jgi:hypothetical protein
MGRSFAINLERFFASKYRTAKFSRRRNRCNNALSLFCMRAAQRFYCDTSQSLNWTRTNTCQSDSATKHLKNCISTGWSRHGGGSNLATLCWPVPGLSSKYVCPGVST